MAIGLLAAICATGCAGTVSSDPWDRTEDLVAEMQTYLGALVSLEYDDRQVVTRSSLERWDAALLRLEMAASDSIKASSKIRPPQVISDFDIALGVVLAFSRLNVKNFKQCYVDADDPPSCILTARKLYREELLKANEDLQEAYGDLVEALLALED